MASNPAAPESGSSGLQAPDPNTLRGYLLDLAGLAFVGACIYVGIAHGAAAPEFAAFAALAGAYLGIKAP